MRYGNSPNEYSMDALPYQCAMWSYGGPAAWRYRLYFSMLWLLISVGRDWCVNSILEFSAIKKNLKIVSDMERVFWAVLLRMLPSCSCFSLRVFPV